MDDLTKVPGVGPVTAKQLEEAGITSFLQLAKLDPADRPAGLSSRVDLGQVVRDAQNFLLERIDDGSAGSEGSSAGDPADGRGAAGAGEPAHGDLPGNEEVPQGGGEAQGEREAVAAGRVHDQFAGRRSDGGEGEAGDHAATLAKSQENTPEEGAGSGAIVAADQDVAAKPGRNLDEPTTITVTGPKRGRWRAGRRFDATPVTIPLDELSDDDFAALERDPALSFTFE